MLLLLVVLSVLTAACSPARDPGADEPIAPGDSAPAPDGEAGAPSATPSPTDGPGLPPLPARFTRQQPQWTGCPAPTALQGGGAAPGGPWQCARLTVPVDYTDPGGRTLSLALIRIPAEEGARRVGSLVLNFGGPGGSGVAALPRLEHLFRELRSGFDLVSFDPRGVGESSGVVCRDDAATDTALQEESFPERPGEGEEYLLDRQEYAAACRAAPTGDLLPHLTTANTARDLDLLRQVLGESRLHYYGASYGTKLGAVYAGLFPERAGRMVFDAVVDPTRDFTGRALIQAGGFQTALDHFLADCATHADCPTGTAADPAAHHPVLTAFLDGLADRPLPAPSASGRVLTEHLAVIGIMGSLYSPSSWPRLREALGDALHAGDGDALLAAADRYFGRDSEGRYRNLHPANTAVNCADFASRPDLDTVRARWDDFREVSPVLGEYLVWELLGCAGWPVVSEADRPEVSAEGARPILLIGTTGDPATPYEGTERMREALGGEDAGVVLTYDGEGHGAYTSGNPCVVDAVNGHLLSGATPEDGMICS
ncbi:alpha/beta hydrolase [Streptomyces aidingensis]|uniref:Alpha/beta hydrolase fold n=1 Tax=Streptomyces aidingensis TaxID=910347 RepID=A0A1I1F327_9ACTN|nr:alpha/beta hydrolase [Streptomyces aidingensis]SFB91570.1 alpha/beta hydrolase fold [Streptomyces aidingensis]